MGYQSDLVERIKSVLNEANGFLAIDNGSVEFVNLELDGILRVKFSGSCAICPLRPMTLRAGVERAVLLKVREVKRVELAVA
ncbi:MAG TPA: NifU family protein [Candidatus Acidoferrales bacterium]|nr:NifU family protein [Candidatus Acidoferrales bacterium]